MNLYEIKSEMQSLIDPETGELTDYESFMQLSMERDAKIENTLLWSKNLQSEADAINAEIKKLQERKMSAQKKATSLLGYAEEALAGDLFKTPRVEVKYRKSTAVEIEDEPGLVLWAKAIGRSDLLTFKEPTVSKKIVGDLLKEGNEIPFARIVERNNMRVI